MELHLFDFFFLIISGMGLLIASYTDLKKREVPDKLSYGLIAIGIIGHIAYAFTGNEWNALIPWAIGLGVGILLALLLGIMGAWAGGDVKLFIAISALTSGILWNSQPWIFPIAWLALSIVAIFPYAILMSAYELKRKPAVREKFLKSIWKKIPFSILFGIVLGLGYASWMGIPWNGISVIESALVLVGLLSVMELGKISSELFTEIKKITELKEGDILGENIMEENGVIVRERSSRESLIKYFRANTQSSKVSIVQAGNANGIEVHEIQTLQKIVREGKLENWILVKKSIAFVPALALGYGITILAGEWIWQLIF